MVDRPSSLAGQGDVDGRLSSSMLSVPDAMSTTSNTYVTAAIPLLSSMLLSRLKLGNWACIFTSDQDVLHEVLIGHGLQACEGVQSCQERILHVLSGSCYDSYRSSRVSTLGHGYAVMCGVMAKGVGSSFELSSYLIGWMQTYADRLAHLTTGRLSIILKSLGMISGGPRRRMLDCLQSHVNQLARPSVRAVDGLSRSESKRTAANHGIPFDINTHTNDLVEDVEEHFDMLACTASEPLEHISCNERTVDVTDDHMNKVLSAVESSVNRLSLHACRHIMDVHGIRADGDSTRSAQWEACLHINISSGLLAIRLVPEKIDTAWRFRIVVVASDVHYWTTSEKELPKIFAKLSSKEHCTPE